MNSKMRVRGRFSSQLLMLVCVAAGVAAFAQAGSPTRGGAPAGPTVLAEERCALVPIPLRAPLPHRQALPRFTNLNGTSINWSGYMVATRLASPQKGSVNSVAGCWVIPTLSCSSLSDTYSACWVGMDNSTVEQIGTEQDWTPNGQVNYVWFEMYPHCAYLISGFPIAAGDTFGAGVTYLGNNTFRLSITNFTQHAAYTVPTRYTRMVRAECACAEWVVEAPYCDGLLPLADFGLVHFTSCTARLNGMPGPINAPYWQADAIDMQTMNGWPKATASGLRDSGRGRATTSAFSVVWSHE